FDFLRRRIAQQPVDQANGLATVGGHGLLAALELIQLLKHGHGNNDLVLFEIKDGVGVVNEDVGVEDVGFMFGVNGFGVASFGVDGVCVERRSGHSTSIFLRVGWAKGRSAALASDPRFSCLQNQS